MPRYTNQERGDTVQQKQSTRMKYVKRSAVVVITVGIVAALCLGVALLLKQLVTKETSNPVNHVAVGSVEIIKAYGTPGSIDGLSDTLYQAKADTGLMASIRAILPGREYDVATQTDHQVFFYAKSKLTQADTEAIQNQTTVFMKAKGYALLPTREDTRQESALYMSYENDVAVCQLTSSGLETPDNAPQYHALACVNKAKIRDEYTAIETLLTLYKKEHQALAATEVSRTVTTEGAMSLALLHVTTLQSHPILLFAAIDNDWEYIANLNDSSEPSNGKYSITPDIQNALRNPKYGDFLVRMIEGGVS
jgi:hypothetical protein